MVVAATGRRLLLLPVAAVCAAAVLAGCVRHPGTPAPWTSAYQAKASLTAEAAASNVATTELGLDAEADGHTTGRYLRVLVGDQENRLEEVVSSFRAVSPPSAEARRVRAELVPVLADAQDAVSEVRIDLDAGDAAAAVATRDELADIVRRLEAFES